MINFRGIKARPHDLEAMLQHGPSIVELHCSVRDFDWTPTRHYDVPLAVHLPEYDDGELLDPASEDENTRVRVEQIYSRAIGRAMAWERFFVGKPLIVFHPGGMGLEKKSATSSLTALRGLCKTVAVLKHVAGGGVEILVVNLPASCWFFGGTWKASILTSGREMADFCLENNIRCTLDLCHLYLACNELGMNPEAEILACLPHVRHIHYSDGTGWDQEGLQIGMGDLPLEKCFEILSALPDMTYAVPEIWFGHENHGRGFIEAWRLLEARFEANKAVMGS